LHVDSVQAAGFHWRIHPAYRSDLEDLIQDPATFLDEAETRVIKHNNVRTVLYLRLGDHDYYVKRYARGDVRERLKARVFESKASREWRILQAGLEAGLPVPVAAAVAEKRRGGFVVGSYLATVALPNVLDLVPHLEAHLREDSTGRHAFLRALGRAVRRFHEAGLLHRDLHSGNVLVSQEGTPAQGRIHFIDLHRGRLRKRLGPGVRRWNLAFLLHSTTRVTEAADRAEVVRGYVEDGPGGLGPMESVLAWIEGKIERLERRRLKSRSRRCRVKSSAFRVEAWEGGTLYREKDFGLEAAREAIRAHQAARDAGAVVKRTRRTILTEVENPAHGRLVVKEFFPRVLDRWTGGRGLRAWRAGNGLRVRALPAVRPRAFLRCRKGGGYLVMDRAPGERLDHHVIRLALEMGETSRAFASRIRDLGRAVADLFRDMHHRGVYHGDLKACNVHVDTRPDGTPALTLMDYDRVTFPDRPLDERRCIKNLAQLHASVTTHVGPKDRGRWFRYYADEKRWRDRRQWYGGIAAACSTKIVVDRDPIE